MSHANGMDQEWAFHEPNRTYMHLDHGIKSARSQKQAILSEIESFHLELKSFSMNFQEYKNILDPTSKYRTQNYIDEEYKRNLETALLQNRSKLQHYQVHIKNELEKMYLFVSNLIKEVLFKELAAWKRNQQLHGIGYHFDPVHLDLVMIQFRYVRLTEISLDNQNYCKMMKDLVDSIANCTNETTITTSLTELYGKFNELSDSLVINSFVINGQPPQVMKKGNKFSVELCSLLDVKLNLIMNFPTVTIHIINEQEAKILLTEKKLNCIIRGPKANNEVRFSGEISKRSGKMECADQATGQLSIAFQNVHLEKINRADRKSTESVVDEKFSLVFISKFKLRDGIDAQVYTVSSPITVTVHATQDPDAYATIFWDYAFAKPNRVPFIVPEKVTWGEIAAPLSAKFASVTGKPLSIDNLNYLAEKLFGIQDNYDSMTLSWSQFCKDNLPDQNVKFWPWLFAIMKLIEKHLKQLWNDEKMKILGFISKSRAEEILSTCPNGTFLLRFSDSVLGGICIAWVGLDTSGQRKVTMVRPFTCSDLIKRALPDRLNDLPYLLYLYPREPKDEAFGKFYAPTIPPSTPSVNGYVESELVTRIPGFDGCSPNNKSPRAQSASQTPLPMLDPNSFTGCASVTGAGAYAAQFSFGNTNSSNNFASTENIMDTSDHLDVPYFSNNINGRYGNAVQFSPSNGTSSSEENLFSSSVEDIFKMI